MNTNHNYCAVKMPEENILKFNQEQKSMRILFTIYVEIEYLIEKNTHMPQQFKRILKSKNK